MVDENDCSVGVTNGLQISFVELSQCQGTGTILYKDQVYRDNNDITYTSPCG